MKHTKKKIGKQLRTLLIQLVESIIAGGLFACAVLLGGGWATVLRTVLMAAFGSFSAYRAVRGGINNYLAWILPPATGFLVYYLIWGYSPEPLPLLITAFFSVVGAAAGEVRNREAER